MNPHNPQSGFEETLRLLARATPPQGLAERLQSRLQSEAQTPRSAAPLLFPAPPRFWRRALAAAAIVLAILGGGWSIVLFAPHAAPATATAPSTPAPAASGFSTAGAMRTPQSLEGPPAPPASVNPR